MVCCASLLLAFALAATSARAQIVSPEEAGRHVGESVTVEGMVETVICSPLACLVSFTADYSGLAASIPGDVVSRFPSPRDTYANRRVRVRGTVVDRSGRPRIEVTDPAALQVVGGVSGGGAVTGERGPVVRVDPATSVVRVDPSAGGEAAIAEPVEARVAAAAEPASAPPAASADPTAERSAEVALPPPPPPPAPPGTGDTAAAASRSRVISPGVVTSRVGGPRPAVPEPRGESLVSRLNGGSADAAAVEARSLEQRVEQLQEENANLAALVQELEARLATLEQRGGRAQGVNEAELPYSPEYVVAGERSTRLQTVKRGWSSERLLRAVGPPLNTVTEANGYMTWYYANGRAVTLDERGRVASSVGF